MKGPLDVLKESWLSGDMKQAELIDWLDQARALYMTGEHLRSR